MKKLIMLALTGCLLLAGLVSATGCENRQEKYTYYITLANQYEAAAIMEDSNAEYYSAVAEQVINRETAGGQQEYDKLMEVVNSYHENAKNYREMAARYRNLASEASSGPSLPSWLPFGQ